MKKILLAFIGLMTLTACATNVTPQPIGGSKADGTVILSYQQGFLQQPIIDWTQAQRSAVARCKAWGYKHAEAFEGEDRKCMDSDCAVAQINKTYQCTK